MPHDTATRGIPTQHANIMLLYLCLRDIFALSDLSTRLDEPLLAANSGRHSVMWEFPIAVPPEGYFDTISRIDTFRHLSRRIPCSISDC